MANVSKYMLAAGEILKSLYLKLFHVVCVTHLLHNCAMKVKSHSEDIDQLIAKVKSATVKNKTRQTKFATSGCLPHSVFTRWVRWLNPALRYAKNLLEAKKVCGKF